MNIFYRISDNSYKKPKLPGATKEFCFLNFLRAFKDVVLTEGNVKNLTIIADNCNESLNIDLIKYTPFETIKTTLGNAGSLKFALHRAATLKDSGPVYFVEDDYVHRDNASSLLEEGLKLADYVTLYDHPDKYTSVYNHGETSQVQRKKYSHWRYTVSTCMTFASRSRIIAEDLEIWDKHISGSHPNDHLVFMELKEKGRKLAVCIPGAACHTDLTFSGWAKNLLIEEWAIDLLCENLESMLPDNLKEMKSAIFVNNPKGWDRLKMLDALYSMKNTAEN